MTANSIIRNLQSEIRNNKGTRPLKPLKTARFPDAGWAVRNMRRPHRHPETDVLLVNPPSPDGGIWIRSQHRVGRRSREGMIWPQCSLAQLAAMLQPDYSVSIIDAIAENMGWAQFETTLRSKAPRYYLTQATAPTLINDMYGVMLAKSLGAKTIAFGTHVTPMPLETMRDYPALDFVLCGEPELTLRELIDVLADKSVDREHSSDLSEVKGLVWRDAGQISRNADRPFIPDLDDLPLPKYELLPLEKYRVPLMRGPFCFVVTSRGCPAGCKFCIKHVSYQSSVRLLSPARILEELNILCGHGIRNIHMYADLFTVNRDQVMGLCDLILREGLKIRWTCNSRVDFVDEEMLIAMGRAGCWMISWGIESGSEEVLKRSSKGFQLQRAHQALQWSRKTGIKNWGYFIIGLPGETVETIRETIDLSKSLPLDLALFHVAAPYPGTPLFFEVIEKGWYKPGTRWEQVDMDRETVLEYENLSGDDLVYWQRRAFREWAFRPGPLLTYLKMLFTDPHTLKRAVRVGLEHFAWALGGPSSLRKTVATNNAAISTELRAGTLTDE
jgi:anaerobic magnesium-protoporphyrin IX monomethyl ester cyclase